MLSMPIKKPMFINNYEKQKKTYEKLRSSGFTSLELMIVVAIVAILAALAVPSFSSTLEKQRITTAAEAILSDLRWARAEAIKRNKQIRVTFTTGSPWSYTVHADPNGDNTLLKTVSGSDLPATTLSSTNFASDYVTFDPIRGISNNGTATIISNNFSAGVIVSTLGRARICGSIGGYEACP